MMILDILLKEVKGKLNSDQHELLTDAKTDSQRLRDFVFDLLQFSKLETGKIKFVFQDSDEAVFHKIISHALEPLKPMLTEKNINFSVDIAKPLKNFQADFQHLSIVFINIIENSIHHVKKNGEIFLSAKSTDHDLEVHISDNGEGIPEDKLQFIFDKFVQAKYFQKDPHGSIGLGLAIAKEIIEAHNGDIGVNSKVGKGQSLFFEFHSARSYKIHWRQFYVTKLYLCSAS